MMARGAARYARRQGAPAGKRVARGTLTDHDRRRFRLARIEALESRHLLSAVAALGATSESAAAQLIVTTAADVVNPDDGLMSLREAIQLANQNVGDDTIQVAAELDGQTIELAGGQLAITDTTGATKILGLGADRSTIDAGRLSRAFDIAGGAIVEIAGLTITRGHAADGGGIRNSGTLTLTDCALNENEASHEGGGIWNAGSLTIVGSNFNQNSDGTPWQQSFSEGGAIENRGTLVVSQTSFVNNISERGGAIENHGELTLTGSYFERNFTADFWTNQGSGGGLDNHGTASVSGCEFREGAGDLGGAIANFGDLSVVGSGFYSNGGIQGGAIYNQGVATLSNSTLSENGGGLFNVGTAAIDNSVIADNFSWSGGGGIVNYGKLELTASTLDHNGCWLSGGAIDNHGSLALSRVSFSGNFAMNGEADVAEPSVIVGATASNSDELAYLVTRVTDVAQASFAISPSGVDRVMSDAVDSELADRGGLAQESLPGRLDAHDNLAQGELATALVAADGASAEVEAMVNGLVDSLLSEASLPSLATTASDNLALNVNV